MAETITAAEMGATTMIPTMITMIITKTRILRARAVTPSRRFAIKTAVTTNSRSLRRGSQFRQVTARQHFRAARVHQDTPAHRLFQSAVPVALPQIPQSLHALTPTR